MVNVVLQADAAATAFRLVVKLNSVSERIVWLEILGDRTRGL